METVKFLVQGSAAKPYEVSFFRSANEITAFCSCPAGESGTGCKHRFSILDGDLGGIVSDNVEQATLVASWFPGSNLETRLSEVRAATRAVEDAKKAEAQAKKRLAAAMHGRN